MKLETIECPECGQKMVDWDGAGFVYCDNCLLCTHPGYDDGVCYMCGQQDTGESGDDD